MGKVFPQTPLKKSKGANKIMRERIIKKQFWINQSEDDLLKSKSNKSGLSES